MNFFEHQDKARQRTGWLVTLFALAVLGLIAMTLLLVMAVIRFGSNTALTLQNGFLSTFSAQQMAEIAIAILLVISAASFYKLLQLRTGGAAVCELLGGQLLDRSSQRTDERKLLNVVEEMAIASGMPVPPVYVLEEASINAFAAGHDNRDAAIGITRGAIELLSRDELQGVIAHEFSHIFNGDMKLNLQLMGWLHGILFIGLVGRFLLDSTSHSRSSRKNSGVAVLVFLGLGLVIIGWCGTFFGKLIKASISRQREFLADASAVQYTRNPDGIAGALKKIGGCTGGSLITHPHAAQASHLFFGNGITGLSSLFATHPPLDERIRAIEPHWDGEFVAVNASSVVVEKPAIDPAHVNIVNGEIVYTPPAKTVAAISTAGVVAAINAVGEPTAEHIDAARKTLDTIPDSLQQLARQTWGASALIHCLLVTQQQEARDAHLALLEQATPGSVHSLCVRVLDTVNTLPITWRLPLVDLCLPSLKLLSTTQRNAFLIAITRQIRLDNHVSPFEWALYRLLRHHLGENQKKTGAATLASAAGSARTVMSALALAAGEGADAAFTASWQQLGLPSCVIAADILDDMNRLDQAVRQLQHIPPLAKPRLLKAFATAITREGKCTTSSFELLRAIADTLDAPMPPLAVSSEEN